MANHRTSRDMTDETTASRAREKDQRETSKLTGGMRTPKVKTTFRVTVPPGTANMKMPVCLVGALEQGKRGETDWDPSAHPMKQGRDGTWSLTLSFPAGAQIEYKYCLGSWDYVELDDSCRDVPNRTHIASEQPNEVQTRLDHVANWRQTAGCGS